MLRSVVYATVPLSLVFALACSDQSNSTALAPRQMEKSVTVDPAGLSFVQNVHLAALPAFDGDTDTPTALNDIGEVVGNGRSSVFRWEGSRGFTRLPTPIDTFTQVLATDVNDKGQVLLTLEDSLAIHDEVAIWDWYGNLTVRRPLGEGMSCQANSINNLGVIAGNCNLIPTVWTAFGNPDALYPNGGGTFIPGGNLGSISDAGYITGITNGEYFEFTPTKHELAVSTNRLAGGGGPHNVNDSGWVAGTSPSSTNDSPAVWTTGLVYNDVYANGDGQMTAVTDDGIAVGYVNEGFPTDIVVPIIWTKANGVQRLPYLEPGSNGQHETGQALHINKSHQILGWVQLASGQKRWVMWTLP